MAIFGYKKFDLANWLETCGLAGWLEIATDDLQPPARQRIANEIEFHYAEAVSAHLAAGEPEHSAQAAALAELGDPQAAAVNFKKSHLTESEVRALKRMEWTASKPFFSFWSLLLDGIPLALFALLFFYVIRHVRFLLYFDFIGGLVLVEYFGFRLIPRLLSAKTLPRRSFLKGLALSCLITMVALTLSSALFIYIQNPDNLNALMLLSLFFYGIAFNPNFRLWNKLRKMGDERNDLPPWQPTAS